MIKLTKTGIEQMQPKAEIARGETHDGPNGCNMSGSGQILRWLAVKGYVNDWCIYVGRITDDWTGIRTHGDKVLGEINIKRLVPCTDEAYLMYRR